MKLKNLCSGNTKRYSITRRGLSTTKPSKITKGEEIIKKKQNILRLSLLLDAAVRSLLLMDDDDDAALLDDVQPD